MDASTNERARPKGWYSCHQPVTTKEQRSNTPITRAESKYIGGRNQQNQIPRLASVDSKIRSQDLETLCCVGHETPHRSGKFLNRGLTAVDDGRPSLVVLLFAAPEVLEGAE